MIYLIYLLLVPISLLLTLVAVLLAPIMPWFAVQKEWWCDNHSYRAVGPVLPTWLNWFMTPDNTLEGDATFQKLNPHTYWSEVKWLWRNPAYSFGLRNLEIPYNAVVKGDTSIKDNNNAKAGWCLVTVNNLFQFRWVFPIGFSRCIYCNFGHNILALVDPNVMPKPLKYEATFVFSPRISGFR
jgi:hypothetical protein